MDNYNILGKRIKESRQSLLLSQADLAQKLHCTQAALSQYENGNREPSLQDLHRIAVALNTSTDYLLGLTNIKSTNTNIKMIGDYLGLTEESIKTLHERYWNYKQKTTHDYLQKEVKSFWGTRIEDKNYEKKCLLMLQCEKQDLDDYLKFINEFICSTAFEIIASCLCDNLRLERTVYDLINVVLRKYNKIKSPLLASDMAEKAYALVEDSEDTIRRYSLNLFDIQCAINDFCKNFTHLEHIKELEYKESFYKKLSFVIYYYTRDMFESGKFSDEELDAALLRDEFQITTRVLEVLKEIQ